MSDPRASGAIAFTATDVLLRQKSLRYAAIPAAVAAIGAAMACAGKLAEPMIKPLIALGATGFVFGTAIAVALFFASFIGLGAREELGELTVTDDAVRFGGKRISKRSEITEGLVHPGASRGGRPVVSLERRGGFRRELVMRDEAQGVDLLRALGLDSAHATAHFSLPWRHIWKAVIGFIAAVIALSLGATAAGSMSGGGLFVMIRFIAPILSVIPMLALRSKLAVGADGILLTEPGNKRFIPYKDLLNVAWLPAEWGKRRYPAVAITLQSGEQLDFTIAYWGSKNGALVERIAEARRTYASGDESPGARLLERGERPVAEWIQALRAAGTGASADARTAALEPQRLWRILEDASGDPKQRAAAAVALSPSLDDSSRARVLAVSEGSASPTLRGAIAAAAKRDADGDLVRALAELEAENAAAASLSAARRA